MKNILNHPSDFDPPDALCHHQVKPDTLHLDNAHLAKRSHRHLADPTVNVEVSAVYMVPVTAGGKCILKLTYQHGAPFQFRLNEVFYVPGLTQRLLSVPKFSQHGNTATISDGYKTIIQRQGCGMPTAP